MQARDSLLNTGTASSVSSTYTSANIPGTPTLGGATATTLNLTNAENGNPSSSPTTYFAVQVVTTSPNDATWLNQWVNASGNPSATAVWMTDAQLDALVLQGLTASTTYGVKVKARNEDLDETALSAEGQGTTGAATLLTFNSKYVVTSSTAVTTTSATLVDDTQASQTFSLTASQTVLVIYQANNLYGTAIQHTGMQNAINVDTTDVANQLGFALQLHLRDSQYRLLDRDFSLRLAHDQRKVCEQHVGFHGDR